MLLTTFAPAWYPSRSAGRAKQFLHPSEQTAGAYSNCRGVGRSFGRTVCCRPHIFDIAAHPMQGLLCVCSGLDCWRRLGGSCLNCSCRIVKPLDEVASLALAQRLQQLLDWCERWPAYALGRLQVCSGSAPEWGKPCICVYKSGSVLTQVVELVHGIHSLLLGCALCNVSQAAAGVVAQVDILRYWWRVYLPCQLGCCEVPATPGDLLGTGVAG